MLRNPWNLSSVFSLIFGGVILLTPENFIHFAGWVSIALGIVLFFFHFLESQDGSRFQAFRSFLKRKRNWLKKNSQKVQEKFTMKETYWQLNLINGIETAMGKEYTNYVRELFENWNLNRNSKAEEIKHKLIFLDCLISFKITSTDILKDFDPNDLKQFESNEKIESEEI